MKKTTLEALRDATAGGCVADELSTGDDYGSRWIEASEQQPQSDKPVLVCGKHKEETIMSVGQYGSLYDDCWYCESDYLEERNITHWMRLPVTPHRLNKAQGGTATG